MKTGLTIDIVRFWISLSFIVQILDSVSDKDLALNAIGDPEIKNGSISELNLNSDEFKEPNVDTNSTSTNLRHSNTTKDTDMQIDDYVDAESSQIWNDYLELRQADHTAVIPTPDPYWHLHYEIVSTSSKSNLCRVQCIALCDSELEYTSCVLGCEKFVTDEWILNCEDIDCIETCSHLQNMTNAVYPSPRPPTVRMTQINPHKLRLSWTNSSFDKPYDVDPNVVVYYVIEKVEVENGKSTSNWTYVMKTTNLSVVETLDVCWEGCYRVAAVSKSGSSGYVNTSHVDRTDLPKPGHVTFLEQNYKTEEDDYLYFNFSWKNPYSWQKEDLSQFVVLYDRLWCPGFPGILPDPRVFYKYDETTQTYYVENFAIHESMRGCSLVYSIIPISKCEVVGKSTEIFFNLTDCALSEEVVCPEEKTYEPLPNITVTRKVIIPENSTVYIEWLTPIDPHTKQTADVEKYRVQWGPIKKGRLEQVIEKVEGEKYLNQTWTYIQVNHTDVTYGVKIIPLQMFQGQLEPSEELSIYLYDIAERFMIDQPYASATEEPVENGDGSSSTLYYVIGGAAVLLLMGVGTVGIMLQKRRKAAARRDQKWRTDLLNHHYTNVPFPKEAVGCMIDNPFYLKQPERMGACADAWETPFQALLLEESLGSGAFGKVVRATINVAAVPVLTEEQSPARNVQPGTTVAVKLLHEHAEEWQKQDFLKEIDMMKNIGSHPNVVSMLGCCTIKDPICLIVEHVAHGDLQRYLKCQREALLQDDGNSTDEKLTLTDLCSFAKQIAIGMDFLSEKGFVHRDLATRNILVDHNKVVKIGDFGLTRYVYDNKIYVTRKGGKLPLKWMAIEAIFDLTFTTASDVWSYGVVLFELITLGGTPYPTIANKDLLKELQTGYRMEKPDTCPIEWYNIMIDCWKENPQDRPSFTGLKELMAAMLELSSTSTSFQLDITTNSQYHCTETDESSEEDESSEFSDDSIKSDINNNEHETDDDIGDNEIDTDNGNETCNVDDVFKIPELDFNTTNTLNNGAVVYPKRRKKIGKFKKKKMKKELKAPRQKKVDLMRESTCSHDELLPPSPCSPSVSTNVAFMCEL